MDYRDGMPGDGAVLGGIARATFIETFGALYALEDLAAFLAQGSDAAYEAELADPDIAVRFALAAGIPVGFCKIGGLQLPAPTDDTGAIEVRQLYIFKPWQGVGIADVLTRWAIDTARGRGARQLWLSVFTGNPRARRFYARHDFVEVTPYRFMVGNQADEDILCRRDL
ncbi:GNAT family N-acetyltransferase [Polymorphobacter fuscus]|uniref:GNAT family N-acetyltransferase n=1 Tax=Sandarakinorhabdus fusca TaxID=1439888 RepID=A0A7C9GXB1_9SPHN|nr:GNAT family N-acetyltransferase [Polymorphobacter fuscus]MQT17134.1 GNAT family N-acetyltransferase [Polymorphobacter fuscus]